MKQLRLRAAARRDLREIWRYSSEHWGDTQADEYLGTINQAALGLALGRIVGVATHGRFLKRRAGSHFLYYREDDRVLTVIRVLHERQDATRQLGG